MQEGTAVQYPKSADVLNLCEIRCDQLVHIRYVDPFDTYSNTPNVTIHKQTKNIFSFS